mmetsp:Transcript_93260/g.301653  ORF Transcript_93260/g.301653 Transcript_93260/m.301653 type:complete len:270 (+) Transcript_93260:2118-2927(+)
MDSVCRTASSSILATIFSFFAFSTSALAVASSCINCCLSSRSSTAFILASSTALHFCIWRSATVLAWFSILTLRRASMPANLSCRSSRSFSACQACSRVFVKFTKMFSLATILAFALRSSAFASACSISIFKATCLCCSRASCMSANSAPVVATTLCITASTSWRWSSGITSKEYDFKRPATNDACRELPALLEEPAPETPPPPPFPDLMVCRERLEPLPDMLSSPPLEPSPELNLRALRFCRFASKMARSTWFSTGGPPRDLSRTSAR